MAPNEPRALESPTALGRPVHRRSCCWLILLLAGTTPGSARARPAPADQASLAGPAPGRGPGRGQARYWPPLGLALPGTSLPPWPPAAGPAVGPGHLAVHAGEAGDLATGADLDPGRPRSRRRHLPPGLDLVLPQRQGAPPPASGLEAVRKALGNGYAARILEARLRGPGRRRPRPLEAQARAWALAASWPWAPRGLAGLLLGLAGLGFALYLGLTPVPPAALPHFGMSGRAAAHRPAGLVPHPPGGGPRRGGPGPVLPFLRPFNLPLVYASTPAWAPPTSAGPRASPWALWAAGGPGPTGAPPWPRAGVLRPGLRRGGWPWPWS